MKDDWLQRTFTVPGSLSRDLQSLLIMVELMQEASPEECARILDYLYARFVNIPTDPREPDHD